MLSSVNDTTGQALPHDYLDDLESFFYVFCWITIGYDGPGKPLTGADRPRVLLQWDQDDASAAANSKGMMITYLSAKVTSYFGPTFQNLLSALHRFLRPHMLSKMEQRDKTEIPRKHLLDLIEPAKAHYADVLAIIDQGILDLKSEPLNAQHTTPAPVTPTRMTLLPGFRETPTLSHSHSGSSLKRQGEEPDMTDESPKLKKQKRRAYAKEHKRAAKTGSGRSGR